MDRLSFSRSKALNNIPTNRARAMLLSIVNKCHNCSGKKLNLQEEVDGLCTRCATVAIVYNRYSESNIPLEYWDLKMEKDFKGDKRLLDKYMELSKDIKSCFNNGSSICFAGMHGVGKTFTTTSLLKKSVHAGYVALYTTFNDIVSTLTQASSEEKFLARKELFMVDFLVIDEIDPRFIASESMSDLYARQLEYIIRTRRQNKLPTFICTNSPNLMETFNGSLKESLGSIIAGYMETFIVLGTDFRKIS